MVFNATKPEFEHLLENGNNEKFDLLICFRVFSCSSDDINKIDNSDLVGKWNWTNTAGGIIYCNETPETTGKTIHLTLMDNYTYSIKEHGNEISNGTYELIMKNSIYSGELEIFIQFPENQQYTRIVMNN